MLWWNTIAVLVVNIWCFCGLFVRAAGGIRTTPAGAGAGAILGWPVAAPQQAALAALELPLALLLLLLSAALCLPPPHSLLLARQCTRVRDTAKMRVARAAAAVLCLGLFLAQGAHGQGAARVFAPESCIEKVGGASERVQLSFCGQFSPVLPEYDLPTLCNSIKSTCMCLSSHHARSRLR